MKRRFVTLDVFTQRRLTGNPLAVVFESQELDAAAMQAIAREFNHPETIFVLPPTDKAHRARLRIFTPVSELPFAGHPTVGGAVGLAQVAKDKQRFVLEEQIGPVQCEVLRDEAAGGRARFILPQLPSSVEGAFRLDSVAQALALESRDIETDLFPVSRWSAGVAFSFVAVKNLNAIARVRIDPAQFDAVFGFGGPGMVFVFCREAAEPGRQFHARMFAPGRGIPEDPATGSAIAAFAGLYVARTCPTDGEHRLIIEQGYEMGRPSLIELSLSISKGILTSASIGGDAIIVTEGTIEA